MKNYWEKGIYCLYGNRSFKLIVLLLVIISIDFNNDTNLLTYIIIFYFLIDILIKAAYNEITRKQLERKKDKVFEILYDWFQKRSKIDVFEINNLIYNILGNSYNFYQLLSEFKQYKKNKDINTIELHEKINDLLKEMDEKIEYGNLNRDEWYFINNLNEYINNRKFSEDKERYLLLSIDNLAKMLIKKNKDIWELKNKETNRVKVILFNLFSVVLAIVLAFFADDIEIWFKGMF
ncbi:hypothetical protein WG909_05245 [Peptostreptococcaceae bacterium AGR-M142]